MEPGQSKIYEIIIECLKKDKNRPQPDALSALSDSEWADMLSLAAMQRIAPLLWHRIKQKKLEKLVPARVALRLADALLRNTLNNLRLNAEMASVLDALEVESIPLIPLKGIVLANTVYKNAGLREMNDIDVLAHPGDLRRIIEILTGMGYGPAHPIDVEWGVENLHHLPAMIKGNIKLEVHWTITHPNATYNVAPDGLWERSLPARIAGRKTLVFSAEDMLLHLCLHTSYLHPFNFGLRPFCDIAELADRLDLDWGIVAERACIYHWQRGVYLALRLAAELAGAAVPDEVLEKLRPADISPEVMDAVLTQVLTDKYFAVSMTKPFAELLASERFFKRLEVFRQRVFLPRKMIADLYEVPEGSPRIYGAYVRRFYDVLRRHAGDYIKFQKEDAVVKSLAYRTKLISDWMDERT